MNYEKIETILNDMKFKKNSIFEVILTTINPDGSFNIAPMGVIRKNSEILEIRIFKTSSTYENLINNPKACINITDDPILFFISAFKEQEIYNITLPVIDENMRVKQAFAHIFIEVNKICALSDNRSRFSCKVTRIDIQPKIPQPFSRGKAEAIEAIIHCTRIEIFSKKGNLNAVERLIRRFTECKDIIERVSAPESVEIQVIGELEKMIAGWRY